MDRRTKVLARFIYLLDTRDIDEILKDLYLKLDLLVYLHEVLVQEKVELRDNETFLESLVMKFYLHGITLYQIGNGFKIQSNYLDNKILSKTDFIDISSLFTVGRAQLETLLMYHHIYVNVKDDDVQNLRYYSWLHSALLQRLQFQDGHISLDIVENTKLEIEQLKNKIINCPAYSKLTDKQQKALISKGNGKTFKQWHNIFEDCNFSKRGFVEKLYYLLSCYAHSEGLSGIQLKQMGYNKLGETNKTYLWLQIATSWILTGAMINNLAERFPVVKSKYDMLDENKKVEVDVLLKILYDN